METSKRNGFSMVELLVVMAVIGILVALLFPAVQAAREAARRTQCRNNLKQLGIAINNYETSNTCFPPGWIGITNGEPDVNGMNGLSWGALVLPQIEEYNAAKKLNAKVFVTNSANAILQTLRVDVFRCPSDISPQPTFSVVVNPPHVNSDLPTTFAVSNYIGSFGSTDYHPCSANPIGTGCSGNGVFYLNSWVRQPMIKDGYSNTMMVGERRTNTTATLPNPIYGTWIGAPPGGVESIGRVLGASDYPPNDPGNHFENYSSNHPGGAFVLLCDGSVQFIANNVDTALFQALATINKQDYTLVFVPQ